MNCEVLFEIFVDYIEILDTKIQDLEDQTLDIKQQVQQLDDRLKLLEDRFKKPKEEHEEERMTSMVGQLAHEIDKEVLHHVLSDLIDVNEKHVYGISNMEKAIKGKRNYNDILEHEDDRLRARKKWDDLKTDLGWEGKHFRYLKYLRQFCLRDDPQADFDPEVIKQALEIGSLKGPVIVDGQDKILLEKCLEMHKHLRERNSQVHS